jgi:antitoxin (DNA-binding transcriptional repressor) of toxin-antitoxin stability system
MKIIERIDATASLADYATHIDSGPLIVIDHGKPVAALVAIEDSDMETVASSEDRDFIELIERSRSRAQAEGGISGEDMRRRFPG